VYLVGKVVLDALWLLWRLSCEVLCGRSRGTVGKEAYRARGDEAGVDFCGMLVLSPAWCGSDNAEAFRYVTAGRS